jgi:hypothetical protein
MFHCVKQYSDVVHRRGKEQRVVGIIRVKKHEQLEVTQLEENTPKIGT